MLLGHIKLNQKDYFFLLKYLIFKNTKRVRVNKKTLTSIAAMSIKIPLLKFLFIMGKNIILALMYLQVKEI